MEIGLRSVEKIANQLQEFEEFKFHILFVILYLLDASDEVHVFRPHRRYLVPDARTTVPDGEQSQWEIIRHEGSSVPLSIQEHGPSAEL